MLSHLQRHETTKSMDRPTAKASMSPSSQESLLRLLVLQQRQQQASLPRVGGSERLRASASLGLGNLTSHTLPDASSLGLSREQLIRSMIAAEQRELQQLRLLAMHREQLALQGLLPTPTHLLAAGLSTSALAASLGLTHNATASSSPQQLPDHHLSLSAREYAATFPHAAAATTTTRNTPPKKRTFAETQSADPTKSNQVASFSSRSSLGDAQRPPQTLAPTPPPKKRLVTVGAATSDNKPPKKKPGERRQDTKWALMLEQLKEYKAEHGNCIVPRGFAPNPRLASWVAEQRKQYKLLTDGKPTSISLDRVAKLEALDFAWNAQQAAWKRHMEELAAFKKMHGHCHVPLAHKKFPNLGLWVKEQRRHYTLLKQGRPSHMTPERAKELDEAGFCWDTHEATWLERFRQLKDYKERHGDCLVPAQWAPNPKLANWCTHQRRQYKKFVDNKPCHITQPRIDMLNEVEFPWYTTTGRSNEDNSDASSVSSSTTTGSVSESGSLPPRKRHRLLM